MAHIHAENLVHGDIHPKNILVRNPDSNPVFVVIDLGNTFEAGPNFHYGVTLVEHSWGEWMTVDDHFMGSVGR